MRSAAAVLFALLVGAVPLLILVFTAGAPPEAGRLPALVVFGSALGAGLMLGFAYVLQTKRSSRAANNGQAPAGACRLSGLPTGLVLAVAGAVLIVNVLIPSLFGWDTRLVIAVFAAGFVIPALPGVVFGVIRRDTR